MLTGAPASPVVPPAMPASILLVDDEARNLDVLESLLDGADYQLVRALSPEQALLLLLDREFAAIVLDVQMPGMSGIELANLIKQRRRTQNIPIIFLTAYLLEDKDVLQGYGTGAVDYLTKPINPQILRSKIAVFVDLFRKTRALAATNVALEQEIAQRQRAEESLRQVNNDLESRVQARTADLLQANLELQAREQALRAREAQLRLVTDFAPVFITQFDRDHRFKFVNRTYARRFGFEPEQLIGRHFTEVMGGGAYAVVREHLDAALAGRRVEFELEVAYAGLGPRWVFVVHEPERAPGGEVVGLVAVTTDITERKQAEREVAAARDQALAASRTKDEFLARLSHELRTPLNPVLLVASEAANNPELTPAVRADFELIAQNVTLEARLIDDLLDVTAITRGKLAFELRPVSVHAILQEALVMVKGEINEKSLGLTLALAAENDTVPGDDMRLRQIFWNVLRNAVKFTPAHGHVTIETDIAPPGDRLRVRVTDTGIGMTEAELARIFAAFAQGDHAARRSGRFGGLGLGLLISRMLAELHSGSITATSPGRDRGTTLTVELPLAGETVPVPAEPRVAEPPVVTVPADGGPRRILLVEDHRPTCEALAGLLRRRRYRVLTAGSVSEARAIAGREAFDLLISDVGLPDGNGCELMAELRQHRDVTGIALTGYGMDEDVSRTQAAGFAAHLTKPVNIQELDRVLATCAAPAVERTADETGPARV